MREFFKPWRRKAGIVILVMACLVLGAWIRGLLFFDFIIVSGWVVSDEQSNMMIASSEMGIEWETNWTDFPFKRDIQVTYHSVAHRQNRRTPRNIRYDIDSHWEFCGFQADQSDGNTNGYRAANWVVPYWSIVLPLTLLSAFLLLSRPRPTISAESENCSTRTEL